MPNIYNSVFDSNHLEFRLLHYSHPNDVSKSFWQVCASVRESARSLGFVRLIFFVIRVHTVRWFKLTFRATSHRKLISIYNADLLQ